MALSVRRFVVAVVNGNSGALMRSSSSSHSVGKKTWPIFCIDVEEYKRKKTERNKWNGSKGRAFVDVFRGATGEKYVQHIYRNKMKKTSN